VSDLDYHQELVGRVVAYLIGRGLRRVDLEPGHALEIMVESRGDEEEAIETFCDIVHWMNDEGLIRVGSIQGAGVGEYFNQVQLTSKAVEGIRVAQESLSGQTIEAVVTKKDGLSADVYHKIANSLGGFVGGFTKSVGGG
jgi:hypothetical protein